MRRVCVFCGSSVGSKQAYQDAARAMGQLLAGRGITLVYGGGAVGLMGVLADAALNAGGDVIGVIPKALFDREIGHAAGHGDECIGEIRHHRLAGVHGVHDVQVRDAGVGNLAIGERAWNHAEHFTPGREHIRY